VVCYKRLEGVSRAAPETPKTKIWPDSTTRPGESNTEWLLRMLLQDIQTLASDAEDLIRAYPPMISAADEVVSDLFDHLEFAERFVQEGLVTQGMLDKVKAVDAVIHEMSDRHDGSLWTDDAVRTRGEWREIRLLAREALASLGYDLEPPPPAEKTMKVFRARN